MLTSELKYSLNIHKDVKMYKVVINNKVFTLTFEELLKIQAKNIVYIILK